MPFAGFTAKGRSGFIIDPAKIVVCGGSAGGYLTLMSGFASSRAAGARCLLGLWRHRRSLVHAPSEYYRKSPLVTKEEAYGVVGGPVLTVPTASPRGKYYLYLRQNGLWAKEVSGFDPATEPHKFDPYCPVRNVTPDYPPTLLIARHGRHRRPLPGIGRHGRPRWPKPAWCTSSSPSRRRPRHWQRRQIGP